MAEAQTMTAEEFLGEKPAGASQDSAEAFLDAGPESAEEFLDAKPQGTLAAMGNQLAQAAVKGTAGAAKGIDLLLSTMPIGAGGTMPVWGYEGVDPEVAAENERRRELLRRPAKLVQELETSPLTQTAQGIEEAAPEVYPVEPQNQRKLLVKAAGTAGGFLPMLATGPLAPLEIAAQAGGEHLMTDFAQLKRQGLSDDDAARQALDRAAASGAIQGLVFTALPKPLRAAAEKYLLGRFGQSALGRFLAGRVATGMEGAVLGAASQAGENVATGQPVLQGTGESAAGLGGINLLLPPYLPKTREGLTVARRPAEDWLPGPAVTPAEGTKIGEQEQPTKAPIKVATKAAQTPQTEKGPEYAVTERIEPESGQPQHPRTAPGAAIPADQTQVRQEAGGPTGGGGGPAPSGYGNEPRPNEPNAPGAHEADVSHVNAGDVPAELGQPSAILLDTVRTAISRHEPIPAGMLDAANAGREVPLALPEGYSRQGEQWIYQEPARAPTAAERLAAENAAAMAAMRASQAAEGPQAPTPLPPEQLKPTERPPAGTPVEVIGERPPDLLDWIENNFGPRVKFSSKADYGDYVARAKGKAREMMSTSRGHAADQVLQMASVEFPRLQTEDDLAEAMVRAGEARMGWERQQAQARKAAAAAQGGAEPRASASGESVKGPATQELVGRIVAAARARRPKITIAERFAVKGTDGKWYRGGSMPWGVKATGERGDPYYFWENSEGTGIGKRYGTREEAAAALAAAEAQRDAEFRSELEKMDEAQLEQQRQYWVQDPEDVAAKPAPEKAAGRPKQRARKAAQNLPTPDKISDFRPGLDRVERRGNRTFVVDLEGQRAPVEVQHDALTEQTRANLYKLPLAKLGAYREITRATPYLSPEGKAERLAVFDERLRQAEATARAADYDRYEELTRQVRGKSLDEGQALAKQIEEIKSRYGGKPPPKPQASAEPEPFSEEDLAQSLRQEPAGYQAGPWRMTQREFIEQRARTNVGRLAADTAAQMHRRAVQEAIARGEQVPAAVLRDYPDLARRGVANYPGPAQQLKLLEEPGDPTLWHLPDDELSDLLRQVDTQTPEGRYRQDQIKREMVARGMLDRTTAQDEALQREAANRESHEVPGREQPGKPAQRAVGGEGAQGERATAAGGTAGAVRPATAATPPTYGPRTKLRNLKPGGLVQYGNRWLRVESFDKGNSKRSGTLTLSDPQDRSRFVRHYDLDQNLTLADLTTQPKWVGGSKPTSLFPGEGAIVYKDDLAGERQAGQERLPEHPAPYSQPAPHSDAVEAWFDRAIAATDVTKGRRMMEGGLSAPIWIPKQALHGALQVARFVYTSTRDVARAIAAAVEHLRGLNLPGFNEAEAREWAWSAVRAIGNGGSEPPERTATGNPPEGMGVREFGEQVRASRDIADAFKGAMTNLLYTKRPQETDHQLADRLIDQLGSKPGADGPALAMRLVMDQSNELPHSVRMALGMQILKRLNAAGRHAEGARFYDEMAPLTTNMAQGLAMLNSWTAMGPEGQLVWAQKKVLDAASDTVAPVRPDLEAAKDELRRINASGAEATTADPGVQRVARESIEQTVADSGATHRAVVMELAEPWAQSSAILDMARAAVRAKADQLLNRGPIPPGLTPARHLRVILDDLASRAASIAAGHYQGAEPGVTLGKKLEQRLGLSEEVALKLARELDGEWQRQVQAAKRKLPDLIAKANRGTGNGSGLDQAIRQQLTAMKTTLGRLVREHFTAQDRAGQELTTTLVREAGLSGHAAQELAEKIKERFSALTSRAKRAALERILRPVKRLGLARPELVDRLVGLSNLGALDERSYWEALRQKLNLPEWTAGTSDTLKAIAERIGRLPEDRVEDIQRAQTEFLNALERAKGISNAELGFGFYISNLLSGLTTHARVGIHTSLQMLGATTAEIERAIAGGRPGDIPLIFEALARSAPKAWQQQKDILGSGIVVGSKLQRVVPLGVLENVHFGQKGGTTFKQGRVAKAVLESWPAKILNLWKYNTRLIAAQHMLYYKPAEEMKLALLAARQARSEGLRGQAAVDRARLMLGYSAGQVRAAEAQALREGLGGTRAKMRVAEILQQNLPEEMRETARDFALRNTFLGDTYGWSGELADAVNRLKHSEHAGVAAAARTIAPFTRIASNLFNESLNYTPVGALRARLAKKKLLNFRLEDLSVEERKDLKAEIYAKATLGTAVLAAIAFKAAYGLKDPNPPFTVYGRGPENTQDKEGWRAAGGVPYSVKIGQRYYSYANTPGAVALAALGNYLDGARDAELYGRPGAKRLSEDLTLRTAAAMMGSLKVVLEQPFLRQMVDLARNAGEENPEVATRGVMQMASRTVSSFVVPNLLRQMDRFQDPTLYQSRDLAGMLTGQVPFVRQEGRPVLNGLGQPVQAPVFGLFTGARAEDPLVRLLSDNNAWPTVPARNQTTVTGVPLNEDEFYTYVKTRGDALREMMGRPTFADGLRRVNAQQARLEAQAEAETNQVRREALARAASGAKRAFLGQFEKAADERAAAAVRRHRGF